MLRAFRAHRLAAPLILLSFVFLVSYQSGFLSTPDGPRLCFTSRSHYSAIDVLRTYTTSPNTPSLEGLQASRDTSPAFRLSHSHRALYDSIVAPSRSARRAYDAIVRDTLERNRTADCGSWQGRYTDLHKKKLGSGVQMGEPGAPKRVVANALRRNGQNGGLGDRILGIVTSFTLALLLDRPWQIYWEYPQAVEETWLSPNIDWALGVNPNPVDASQRTWTHALRRGDYIFPRINEREKNFRDIIPRIPKDFEELNAAFPEEVTTTQSNHGGLLKTLAEPDQWMSKKLRSFGLTAENAWRCVLNYLFTPLPRTNEAIAHYSAILAHPSVLSVAIQIRTGDENLADNSKLSMDELDLSGYRYHFQCAADMAQAFAKPGHKHVVFFISTDMNALSARVANDLHYFDLDWRHPTLPYPVGLNTAVNAIHFEQGNNRVDVTNNTLSAAVKQYAMQGTILDNWVFDAADYKITAIGSGFGLISHYRSYKSDSALQLHRDVDREPKSVKGLFCNATEGLWTLNDYAYAMKGG